MSDAPRWQAIEVQVAGRVLLVAVSNIVEVLDLLPCTAIPDTKPWFLGVVSSKGNVLAVTDLGGFLFAAEPSETPVSKLLLVRGEDENFALRVDAISGLKKYPLTALVTDIVEIDASLEPYVREQVHHNDEITPVLDTGLVVSSHLFMDVRSDALAG